MLALNTPFRKAAAVLILALPLAGCEDKPDQSGAAVGPPPADAKAKQEEAIKNAMQKGKAAPAPKPEEKAAGPETKKP